MQEFEFRIERHIVLTTTKRVKDVNYQFALDRIWDLIDSGRIPGWREIRVEFPDNWHREDDETEVEVI